MSLQPMNNMMKNFPTMGGMPGTVYGNPEPGPMGLMDRFMNPMTQAGLAMLTNKDPSEAADRAMRIKQQQFMQPYQMMQMNMQMAALQRQQQMEQTRQQYINGLPENERVAATLAPDQYFASKFKTKEPKVVDGYLAIPDDTAEGGYRFISPSIGKDGKFGDFEKYKDLKSYETGLRKEFDTETNEFGEQVTAYGRIKASAEDPTAAGDMALIFNFMKMLDPQSVVRESEYATAANAAGIPEQIRGLYNRIVDGQRLDTRQRSDFLNRSQRIYNEARDTYNFTADNYRNLAIRNKIDPENVIINKDRYGMQELTALPASAAEKLDIPSTADELFKGNEDLLDAADKIIGG